MGWDIAVVRDEKCFIVESLVGVLVGGHAGVSAANEGGPRRAIAFHLAICVRASKVGRRPFDEAALAGIKTLSTLLHNTDLQSKVYFRKVPGK